MFNERQSTAFNASPCNILYVSRWDKGGKQIIDDLINSQFKSKQELVDDFIINFNFIDHARLKHSIPLEWSHENNLPDPNSQIAWSQPIFNLMTAANKSNQLLKMEFMKFGDWIPTSKGFWGYEVNIPISDDFWPNTYKLPFAIGYDNWAKMFQFKILHQIPPTIKKHVQWGIKYCKKCDFCDMEDESIVYLFCECDVAGGIWEEVVNWFNSLDITRDI